MNQLFITGYKLCLILLAGVFYIYYGIYKMLFIHPELIGGDFHKGYFAALNLLNHMPIYTMPEHINPYLYPPLTVLFFVPFTLFSIQTATILWFFLCHAIIISSAYIVYGFGREKGRLDSVVAVIMCFGFSMPMQGLLLTGNINIVIFLGVSLVYMFFLTRKRYLTPLSLAFCSFIKFFPSILVLLFLRRKYYFMFFIFLITGILLAVFSVLLFGWNIHNTFINQLTQASKYITIFHSTSFTHVIMLITPWVSKCVNIAFNILFGIFMLGLWYKISRISKNEIGPQAQSDIVDFFVLSIVMVTLFPSSWIFYNAFFIFPFYFIIFSWLLGEHRLKLMPIFFILFFTISWWEIISYKLPVSLDGSTIHQILKQKDTANLLFTLLALFPFFLNMLFFLWLLFNYHILRQNIAEKIHP